MLATNLGLRIANWACGLDGRKLPRAVVEKLKLAALDTLAAMLAGAGEEVTRRVITYARKGAGKGEASIVGHRARARLPGAALANGTMAHACDYDNSSWTMWGHPTAPVLPAALAAAERDGLSGAEFLAALAVGIEVEKAIGIGCQPEHYNRGYHATASLGVFGAAAAAAKALGLDPEPTQMALGLAASRAAGLRGNTGTMAKPLHVGFAARDGMEAALLAGAGVTASRRVLEGPMGFFDVCAPDHGPVDGIADRLGNPFEVVDPGLSPKLYPSCSETHSAVDAILEMRAEGLRAADVQSIRCGITPAARGNLVYSDPKTPLEAKFSQEYCLAAPLVSGKLTLAEFAPEAVNHPAVRALMPRIQVAVHPDLTGADSMTFSSPAIVEVETKDGRTLRKLVREMRGHPKNPIPPRLIEAKFVECGERALKPAAVRRALALVMELDTAKSLRPLLRALTPPAGR